MERAERLYLEALTEILEKRYPAYRYSINGYADDALCLEKNQSGWEIYLGERGNKSNLVVCKSLIDACVEYIKKMEVGNEVKEMLDELSLILVRPNKPKAA